MEISLHRDRGFSRFVGRGAVIVIYKFSSYYLRKAFARNMVASSKEQEYFANKETFYLYHGILSNFSNFALF